MTNFKFTIRIKIKGRTEVTVAYSEGTGLMEAFEKVQGMFPHCAYITHSERG